MKKNLLLLFYILLAFAIGTLLVSSFTKPQSNLIPFQSFVLTIFITIVLLAASFILIKLIDKNKKSVPVWLIGIIVFLFSAAIYYVGCTSRNNPSSLYDYGMVYRNASALASGRVQDEQYFTTYSNNIMVLLILSKIIRFSNIFLTVFGVRDPYYVVLLIGVLITATATISGAYLIRTATKSEATTFVFLASFMIMLPIWVNSATLYTDHMSFASAIVSVAFMFMAWRNKNRAVSIFATIVSAFLIALGILIKVTCIIPLIAGIICVALSFDGLKEEKKRFLINSFIWIAVFILTLILGTEWKNSYSFTRKASTQGDPIIAWVGLGLVGEGSYADNEMYVDSLHELSSKSEKEEYVREYINQHISEISSIRHYVSKIRCNYASGYFGADDYIYVPEKGYENHFMARICHPFGQYYWRCSQITFGYAMSIYIIYFFGCIAAAINICRGKKINVCMLLCDVTFIGYFWFLMIWEANNRQLYNMLPILLLGFVIHIYQLIELNIIKVFVPSGKTTKSISK